MKCSVFFVVFSFIAWGEYFTTEALSTSSIPVRWTLYSDLWLLWNEAARFCRDQGGHLPVTDTYLTFNAFRHWVNTWPGRKYGNRRNEVWTGLYEAEKGPDDYIYKWERGGSQFYLGDIPKDFWATNIGEPNNFDFQPCVRMPQDRLKLKTLQCNDEENLGYNRVVCEFYEECCSNSNHHPDATHTNTILTSYPEVTSLEGCWEKCEANQIPGEECLEAKWKTDTAVCPNTTSHSVWSSADGVGTDYRQLQHCFVGKESPTPSSYSYVNTNKWPKELGDATVAPKNFICTLVFNSTVASTTPAETTLSETTMAETTPAETTLPETTLAVTTLSETTPADTTLPETTLAVTTLAKTTPAETTLADTKLGETTLSDITLPDTTLPGTTLPDTTQPETTPQGTRMSETTKSETTQPKTTQPVQPEITLPNAFKPGTDWPETTSAVTSGTEKSVAETTQSQPSPAETRTTETEWTMATRPETWPTRTIAEPATVNTSICHQYLRSLATTEKDNLCRDICPGSPSTTTAPDSTPPPPTLTTPPRSPLELFIVPKKATSKYRRQLSSAWTPPSVPTIVISATSITTTTAFVLFFVCCDAVRLARYFDKKKSAVKPNSEPEEQS
ncbi:hypothetical protein V1264_003019 [Littorina saxatilis]|uniref:C-type lectin domain-containing protein n=1 Tax=Littorina saxatilis TaxID=31220 RepID=A0AAN9B4P0_9CAEN